MQALLVVHAGTSYSAGETCLAGLQNHSFAVQFIRRARCRHGSVSHLADMCSGRLLIDPLLHPLGGEPVFKTAETDLLAEWIGQHARRSQSVLNVLGSMDTAMYRVLVELSRACDVRLHFAPGLTRLVA